MDRSQVSREGGTLSLSAFSSSLLWNSFSLLDRGEETCCSHGNKACMLHSLSHTHTHTHPLSHTHTHTHPLSPSLSLIHTHTLTCPWQLSLLSCSAEGGLQSQPRRREPVSLSSLFPPLSFFSVVAPPFPPSVLLLLSLSMAHLLPSEGPLLLLWEVTPCSLHWLGQLQWTGSIQGR